MLRGSAEDGGRVLPPQPSPKAGSKLCREKKNNARNDSGWQINKLALITIRVSKTFFFSCSSALSVEPFCSCSVYSRAGRLELGAASHGGTTPRVPGRGSPQCSRGTLLRQLEAQRGHPQRRRCLLRNRNGAGGCNGRAPPRLLDSGL